MLMPFFEKDKKPDVLNLLLAAQRGQWDVCEKLVAGGVNVNSTDDNGYTALMYAAHGLEPNKGCETLIKLGADVNMKDKITGKTALIIAAGNDASNDKPALLELFINNKADVNAKDKYGEGTWDKVFDSHDVENKDQCIGILLRAGVNVPEKHKQVVKELYTEEFTQRKTRPK